MIIVYAAILCAAAAVLAGTIVLAKRLCLKDAITRKTREAEPDDYAQEDYYERNKNSP